MEIENLVLDTNYFVNRLESIESSQYYTTPSVISEIKDDVSKQYLDNFRAVRKLEVVKPEEQYLEEVKQSSLILNQFAQLSRQDLEVIALSLQLSQQLGLPTVKVEKIDYDQFEFQQDDYKVDFEEVDIPDTTNYDEINEKAQAALTQTDVENIAITQKSAQLLKDEPGWQEVTRKKKVPVKKQHYQSLDFNQGEWITKQNIDTCADPFQPQQRELQSRSAPLKLAIYTEDRGMQNLILALGLKLVNSQQFVIDKVKHFALKCSSCKSVFFNSDEVLSYFRNKPFKQLFESNESCSTGQLHCPQCSNTGLMRIAVYIQNGRITTTKGIKQFDLKGTVYNLADLTKNRFAGYKKAYLLHPELYEEKQIQNAQFQSKNVREFEFGDDNMKGVGKELNGNDVAYFLKKNPNQKKMPQMKK